MGAMAAILGLGTGIALQYAGQKHREKEQDEQFNKDLRKQLLLNHLHEHPESWQSIAFQKGFEKEFGTETTDILRPSLNIQLAQWARGRQEMQQTRNQMAALILHHAGVPMGSPANPPPNSASASAAPMNVNVNGGSAPPAAAPGPTSGPPAAPQPAALPASAPGPMAAPSGGAPPADDTEAYIADLEQARELGNRTNAEGNPLLPASEVANWNKTIDDKIAAARKQRDKATTEANRREDAATRERERREDAATARAEHRADRATTMAAAEVARTATREAAQEARIGTMENTLVTKNNVAPAVASGIARALVTGATLTPSQERAYAKAMPAAANYEKDTWKPLQTQLGKAKSPEERQQIIKTNNDKLYDVADSMGMDQDWIDDHFMVDVPTVQLPSAGALTKLGAKIGMGGTTALTAAQLKQLGWEHTGPNTWQPPGGPPAPATAAMR